MAAAATPKRSYVKGTRKDMKSDTKATGDTRTTYEKHQSSPHSLRAADDWPRPLIMSKTHTEKDKSVAAACILVKTAEQSIIQLYWETYHELSMAKLLQGPIRYLAVEFLSTDVKHDEWPALAYQASWQNVINMARNGSLYERRAHDAETKLPPGFMPRKEMTKTILSVLMGLQKARLKEKGKPATAAAAATAAPATASVAAAASEPEPYRVPIQSHRGTQKEIINLLVCEATVAQQAVAALDLKTQQTYVAFGATASTLTFEKLLRLRVYAFRGMDNELLRPETYEKYKITKEEAKSVLDEILKSAVKRKHESLFVVASDVNMAVLFEHRNLSGFRRMPCFKCDDKSTGAGICAVCFQCWVCRKCQDAKLHDADNCTKLVSSGKYDWMEASLKMRVVVRETVKDVKTNKHTVTDKTMPVDIQEKYTQQYFGSDIASIQIYEREAARALNMTVQPPSKILRSVAVASRPTPTPVVAAAAAATATATAASATGLYPLNGVSMMSDTKQ